MRPIFWSDQLAFAVTQKFPDRDTYVCAAGISPSGIVHVGNFREIITVDFVVKSLQERGEDTRFIYSWDDYDRFRKVPANVPDKWEQYLGLPLAEVPDPWDCHESYAEHFEQQLEDELEDMHMDIEFIHQSKMFNRSEYADLIRKALNHSEEIRDILNEYRADPRMEGWLPVRVYCRKCGKDFTEALDYNGDYRIQYRCNECDKEFTIDFKENDSVKPPWRVDWPMRWHYENVAFEPGGKEHSVEGGSRTTAVEIAQQIYDQEPPIYQMYEFITRDGKKISSSSGEDAFTVSDLKAIYPPEMIRFLFSETKPKKEFDIGFGEEVIQRYNKFDRIEDAYFNPGKIDNDKQREHWKRVYELAMVEIPDEQPARAPFDHLAFLAQTRPKDEWRTGAIGSLKRTGHIDGELSEQQKDQLIERMEKANTWARNHAPDKYRYRIQDEVPDDVKEQLSTEQREAMQALAGALHEKEFADSDELDGFLFELKDEHGVGTGEFFTAAYLCLLNREKGPRLSRFIAGLGEDRVASILETV